MYFRMESVPAVVTVCIALYNFIFVRDISVHEGVGKDEVYRDNDRTKRGQGPR